jgi:NAD(P)-dependent dehydrogenase (short-subunit alcohol dehydrogenase family)
MADNNGRLAGRVAVVTGGANGIGAAFAKHLAAEGAAVVIGDLEDAAATIGEIEAAGGRAAGQIANVADQAQVDALMQAAVDEYGQLDILLNNAGYFTNITYNSVMDIDPDEWDTVMRINIKGVWHCVKAALPHLRKSASGDRPAKIISVASTTPLSGAPYMLHYITSKGGVIALTRGLAKELGDDNICVNALSLGLTESPRMLESGTFEERRAIMNNMRSLKRAQTPEDCTGAAVYLASADSDFVTGQSLVIDGGMVFR